MSNHDNLVAETEDYDTYKIQFTSNNEYNLIFQMRGSDIVYETLYMDRDGSRKMIYDNDYSDDKKYLEFNPTDYGTDILFFSYKEGVYLSYSEFADSNWRCIEILKDMSKNTDNFLRSVVDTLKHVTDNKVELYYFNDTFYVKDSPQDGYKSINEFEQTLINDIVLAVLIQAAIENESLLVIKNVNDSYHTIEVNKMIQLINDTRSAKLIFAMENVPENLKIDKEQIIKLK